MITKTAVLGVGPVMGAVRVNNLSDREKETLRKHYGIPTDSGLYFRNIGRGIVGDAIGTSLGATLGGAATGGTTVGTGLGAVLGSLAGSGYMTKKYSKGGFDRSGSTKTASLSMSKTTLQKLGEALFSHRQAVKDSEDAVASVDYLVEEGVLS